MANKYSQYSKQKEVLSHLQRGRKNIGQRVSACSRKRAFDTFEIAENYALNVVAVRYPENAPQKPYRCDFCHRFHLFTVKNAEQETCQC